MARPCYHCLEIMKTVNIRYCYYSTYEGNIICEKVSNMISIQISNNNKRDLDRINNNHNNNDKLYYYENLMKKIIPKNINEKSINNFIEYNFNLLFPKNYYYVIIKNKIIFYNDINVIIMFCYILQ
jgi:hypothetical protein